MKTGAMALMRSLRLFESFTDAELEMLGIVFRVREFPAGTRMCREGFPGAGLYIIVSGTVDLVREPVPGQVRRVASQGPGTLLGQISIIDGSRRNASADAVNDVVALEMDRADFERLFEAQSLFAYKLLDLILRDLSFRLRKANEALEEIDPGTIRSVEAMMSAIESVNRVLNTTSEMKTLIR
ncbi:MAG: cyclic nucleotide-binding domain-containing protein [Deltaproteobacteria bacterium]|nr:cyclic nucleotide-binding domain-containing protein [Deltaproteobacteria bacterium]